MDDELVRALLQDQHPDLAELPLKEVVGGWGNQMWRLGDDLAVRVPRFDGGPELLKEYRWLPEWSTRLPLPIPTPVRLGEPSDLFPKHWLVTTWVHGEPADHVPITEPAATDVLIDFLQALHIPAPADAPSNDRSVLPAGPLPFPDVHEHLDRLDEARAIWEDAQAAPAWDGPPVWVHGDLHPANVVVADGTLTGVVDFGDLSSGDPATDLAAAWVLLPTGEADRFFARHPVDAATVRRARGWAVLRALFLVAMGVNGEKGVPGGKTHWGPIGHEVLDRLTTAP